MTGTAHPHEFAHLNDEISSYIKPAACKGVATLGQRLPQHYFHPHTVDGVV